MGFGMHNAMMIVNRRKVKLGVASLKLRELLSFNVPHLHDEHEMVRMTATAALTGMSYWFYLNIIDTFRVVFYKIDCETEANISSLIHRMTLRTQFRGPVISETTAREIRILYANALDLEEIGLVGQLSPKAVEAGARDCLRAMELLIVDLDGFCHA